MFLQYTIIITGVNNLRRQHVKCTDVVLNDFSRRKKNQLFYWATFELFAYHNADQSDDGIDNSNNNNHELPSRGDFGSVFFLLIWWRPRQTVDRRCRSRKLPHNCV